MFNSVQKWYNMGTTKFNRKVLMPSAYDKDIFAARLIQLTSPITEAFSKLEAGVPLDKEDMKELIITNSLEMVNLTSSYLSKNDEISQDSKIIILTLAAVVGNMLVLVKQDQIGRE